MHKFFITLLSIAFFTSLDAQNKGDFSIGLSTGAAYGSRNTNTYTSRGGNLRTTYSFSASVNPEIGYFVLDRFRLSVSAGYGILAERQSERQGAAPKQSTQTLAIGPGVSYYFKLADNLYYTPELGACYAIAKAKQRVTTYYVGEEGTLHVNADDCVFNMRGCEVVANLFAFEYKPSDRIGIAVSIGQVGCVVMTGEDKERKIDNDISSVDANFNAIAQLGIRMYL